MIKMSIYFNIINSNLEAFTKDGVLVQSNASSTLAFLHLWITPILVHVDESFFLLIDFANEYFNLGVHL